jgi:predicted regulator of Ras-like GTPase activity (Roadblock/LC7/MglB family)
VSGPRQPDGPPDGSDRVEEAPRDQEESSFTAVLRRVCRSTPGVLAAVFVDNEGECVDYCSAVDPFEAKVVGAQMRVATDVLGGSVPALGGGCMHAVEVYGASRELVARLVDDHYLLVVLARAGTVDERLLDTVEAAVADLRHEAGVEAPPWDPQAAPLRVELRQAIGWEYAPAAFRERGKRVRVSDVLGKWVETGGAAGGSLCCFRVRTEEGVELTLAHDLSRDRWTRG